MKLKNLEPFQCLVLNDSSAVVVNFGSVICLSQNTENCVFVPTIGGQEIKRFGEEEFPQRNTLPLTGPNAIISLKIYLENVQDLVNAYTLEFEDIALYANEVTFLDAFYFGMSKELQQEHFNLPDNETVLDYNFSDRNTIELAKDCYFNRLVNWSPKVLRVELVQSEIEDFNILEDDPLYNFIQVESDNYYKLVPIAMVIDTNVIQIVNFDYCFSFPFFWLDRLKTEF